MTLLLADDDTEVYSSLREFFRDSGYALEFEPNGKFVPGRVETGAYDLLILDVTLSSACGFELLHTIRKSSQLPVLVLTAQADRAARVRSLELGADDYVLKPFYPDELLARIRAILRRASVPRTDAAPVVDAGDLRLLPGNRDALFQGRPLGLTSMECEILDHLMRRRGRVVSRDSLSLHLYKRLTSPFDRSIDTHISRIRRKLGEGGNMILSVRGTGYQLRSGASTQAYDEFAGRCRA